MVNRNPRKDKRRSFKVINVNGKAGKDRTYYKATNPIGAASKMASLYFRVTKEKKCIVTLEEITRGRSGKTFVYVVKRVKAKLDPEWIQKVKQRQGKTGSRPFNTLPRYRNVVMAGSKYSVLDGYNGSRDD